MPRRALWAFQVKPFGIGGISRQARSKQASRQAEDGAMAEDLITIVDVTDPDDPSFGDIRSMRRPLTSGELATLRPMLEKVGAYRFFCMEFNFADGPAVKQFIDTVEIAEYKRTKQRKIVQEKLQGTVAGRQVVINSELIEKAFGLVDDGENISKPKGETSGLHAFYIKPKYHHLCQNYRGVFLRLFRFEYSYFANLAHQIQAYCCGGAKESQITLTHYRAVDLMIRGKPVNWNRYLLQNFQDKLRKYKAGPCPLYFGGTLTALIYTALNVDYGLVNKRQLVLPPPAASSGGQDGEAEGSKQQQKQIRASSTRSRSRVVYQEAPVTRSRKRKREQQEKQKQQQKQQQQVRMSTYKRQKVVEVEDEEQTEVPSLADEGLIQLHQQQQQQQQDQLAVARSLRDRYEQFNSLQSELQMEHIVSKQLLEQSVERVRELEEALQERDRRVAELEEQLAAALEKHQADGAADAAPVNGAAAPVNGVDEAGPLKLRLKKSQLEAAVAAAASAAKATAEGEEHGSGRAASSEEAQQQDLPPEEVNITC